VVFLVGSYCTAKDAAVIHVVSDDDIRGS